MNQHDFGNKLVEIRKAKGLTQSELAEICDVSYRTIQRIESGKVTPRGFTIKTLSAALDFDFLNEFSKDLSRDNKTIQQRFTFSKQIITQIIDLFNLKTNTMRKLTILTIIFGLIGTGLFAFTGSIKAQRTDNQIEFSNIDSISTITKKDCIKRIGQINRKATFHNQPIDLIKTYAKKSNYNFDTYVILSELISKFGHSTKPAMEIANVLFLTQKDCDLFNEIAPLIFLNTNEHNNKFVDLAKRASESSTDLEKEKIRKEIDKYRQQAEFKTLNEAFEKQKKI